MTKMINTNGIQLAYDDQGYGAQTLIVMHGLTANLHSFDGLMRAGLANGYRVIRMDLRGRGLSDKPESGYDMYTHAKDIIGLMDALRIDKAVLVGHSFGGLLATVLAGEYPDRITKIVVIDAGREATNPETLDKIKPSLDRLGTIYPSWEIFINAIKNSPYYSGSFWDEDLEAYYRADVEILPDGTVKSRCYGKGLLDAAQHNIGYDWVAIMHKVKCPALLIHAPAPLVAGGSPILSQAGAQETVALLGNCQYQAVGGHHITMVFGQHGQQVVHAIRQFVG